MTTLIRAPKGSARREVDLDSVEIPDLWHVAIKLNTEEAEMILECWHLCHDLLAHAKKQS